MELLLVRHETAKLERLVQGKQKFETQSISQPADSREAASSSGPDWPWRTERAGRPHLNNTLSTTHKNKSSSLSCHMAYVAKFGLHELAKKKPNCTMVKQ